MQTEVKTEKKKTRQLKRAHVCRTVDRNGEWMERMEKESMAWVELKINERYFLIISVAHTNFNCRSLHSVQSKLNWPDNFQPDHYLNAWMWKAFKSDVFILLLSSLLLTPQFACISISQFIRGFNGRNVCSFFQQFAIAIESAILLQMFCATAASNNYHCVRVKIKGANDHNTQHFI